MRSPLFHPPLELQHLGGWVPEFLLWAALVLFVSYISISTLRVPPPPPSQMFLFIYLYC